MSLSLCWIFLSIQSSYCRPASLFCALSRNFGEFIERFKVSIAFGMFPVGTVYFIVCMLIAFVD